MTHIDKIRVKGWRASDTVVIQSHLVRNSQIGQLLFYLVVLQLKRLQLYLSPLTRQAGHGPLQKALGLFMEEGKVIN